jgi:hypothetical protein
MKNKSVGALLAIFLAGGCMSDIATILNKTNTADSGYLYFFTPPSMNSELAHFRELQSDPQVKSDSILTRAINEHIRAIMVIPRQSEAAMIAIKKPPAPCPIGSCIPEAEYISFFTVNPDDRLIFFINDNEFQTNPYAYDELTKIRTVKIPDNMGYKAGDAFRLKFTVSFYDNENKIQQREIDWDSHSTL